MFLSQIPSPVDPSAAQPSHAQLELGHDQLARVFPLTYKTAERKTFGKDEEGFILRSFHLSRLAGEQQGETGQGAAEDPKRPSLLPERFQPPIIEEAFREIHEHDQ